MLVSNCINHNRNALKKNLNFHSITSSHENFFTVEPKTFNFLPQSAKDLATIFKKPSNKAAKDVTFTFQCKNVNGEVITFKEKYRVVNRKSKLSS